MRAARHSVRKYFRVEAAHTPSRTYTNHLLRFPLLSPLFFNDLSATILSVIKYLPPACCCLPESLRWICLGAVDDRTCQCAPVDVQILLCRDAASFVSRRDVAATPDCPKPTVPEREERLGEIGLDAPALMMDVVIRSIVVGEVL